MESKNWKQNAFIFVIIGSALYVILTFIGMILYPGGNAVDNNQPGYSFFYNFFSDLGRSKSFSGQDNTISMVLYIIATGLFGLSIIPFSIAFRDFFIETNEKSLETSRPGVFVGGDLMRGPSTVVAAVADGMRAAREIDEYLKNR